MEGNAVDSSIEHVSRNEVEQTLNEIKIGKAFGPSDVSLELIAVSKKVLDFIELARQDVLSELLYAGDLVMMSETIDTCRKWKKAFESKDLKVNFGITKVIVNGGIIKDGLSISKKKPCWVCDLTVNAK